MHACIHMGLCVVWCVCVCVCMGFVCGLRHAILIISTFILIYLKYTYAPEREEP